MPAGASAPYPGTLIALHWLTALLLVVSYASMELRGLYPTGSSLRQTLRTVHFGSGATIFVLMLVRLALRARHPPPLSLVQSRGLRLLASATHLSLYLLLLAMPLLGWASRSARGKSAPLFGLDVLPVLPIDRAWAAQLEDVHSAVASLGYALIALHVTGALVTHHLRREPVLHRMGLGRRGQRSTPM